MKKQNKKFVLNLFISILIGLFFSANTHGMNLNMDVTTILNNEDYAEKAGNWRESVQNRTQIDFSECSALFFNGIPPSISSSIDLKARPLCFDGVAIAYSASRKSPLYIAEVLDKSSKFRRHQVDIPNALLHDSRLPENERAKKSDFDNNLFDVDSNYKINNGIPMALMVRSKTWAIYEEQVAKRIRQASGKVYLITGAVLTASVCGLVTVSRQLLESNNAYVPWGADKIVEQSTQANGQPSRYDLGSCTIGSGVAVPTFIYRLAFDPAAGQAWVYWIDNSNTLIINETISYSELVRRTGIKFFPNATIL